MHRSIIATISIDHHRNLPGSGWLHHFAIKNDNDFDRIVEKLINRALKHAVDLEMSTVEMSTTEYQYQLRELLLKIDFNMKQQYTFGSNSFRIMKSQMGIDLTGWSLSKNK